MDKNSLNEASSKIKIIVNFPSDPPEAIRHPILNQPFDFYVPVKKNLRLTSVRDILERRNLRQPHGFLRKHSSNIQGQSVDTIPNYCLCYHGSNPRSLPLSH